MFQDNLGHCLMWQHFPCEKGMFKHPSLVLLTTKLVKVLRNPTAFSLGLSEEAIKARFYSSFPFRGICMCVLNTKSVKVEFQHKLFFSPVFLPTPPRQSKSEMTLQIR